MTQITIAGFSSVGKKTLIMSLLAESKYRERFGVVGCPQAFGYAFQSLGKMLGSAADTVLFQWQYDVDDYTRKLQHIGNHKIYLLWRDYKQHHADWCKIYGATNPWVFETNVAYIKEKWHQLVDYFEGRDFEVVNVTDWF